jgi:succinate dehydrogenase/fumarate reductase-like Fe-S protein
MRDLSLRLATADWRLEAGAAHKFSQPGESEIKKWRSVPASVESFAPWNNIPPMPHNNHNHDSQRRRGQRHLVLRYLANFGQCVQCNLVCSKTNSIENTHCLPAQLASVAHRQGINYSQYSTQADSARMARICSGPMGGKGC